MIKYNHLRIILTSLLIVVFFLPILEISSYPREYGAGAIALGFITLYLVGKVTSKVSQLAFEWSLGLEVPPSHTVGLASPSRVIRVLGYIMGGGLMVTSGYATAFFVMLSLNILLWIVGMPTLSDTYIHTVIVMGAVALVILGSFHVVAYVLTRKPHRSATVRYLISTTRSLLGQMLRLQTEAFSPRQVIQT